MWWTAMINRSRKYKYEIIFQFELINRKGVFSFSWSIILNKIYLHVKKEKNNFTSFIRSFLLKKNQKISWTSPLKNRCCVSVWCEHLKGQMTLSSKKKPYRLTWTFYTVTRLYRTSHMAQRVRHDGNKKHSPSEAPKKAFLLLTQISVKHLIIMFHKQ